MNRHRRAAVALLIGLVFALAPVRAAWADRAFPSRGIIHIDALYGSGSGETADFDSFQYPSIGARGDIDWFTFGFESPAPFLLFDGVAAALGFLTGGWDTLPLFDALNGEQSPGRIPAFVIDAAVRPLRSGTHGLEVGAAFGLDLLGPEIQGARRGGAVYDLGARAGYVFSNEDVRFHAFATGGNGFSGDASGNPFLGLGGSIDVRLLWILSFHAAFDVKAQSLLVGPLPGPGDVGAVREWTAWQNTHVGIGGMF